MASLKHFKRKNLRQQRAITEFLYSLPSLSLIKYITLSFGTHNL